MEECVRGLMVENFGSRRVLREVVVKGIVTQGSERESWRFVGAGMREVILWGFLLIALLWLWKRRARRVTLFTVLGLRTGLREGGAVL